MERSALQWPVQHVPLILAGHGVYAGRTSTYPARLVDIAPTLELSSGLPVAAHDGTVLHDALYGATAESGPSGPDKKEVGTFNRCVATPRGRCCSVALGLAVCSEWLLVL